MHCKDRVFTDFNESNDKVYGINSEFSEVIWLYCSDTNSVANGGSGENDRYSYTITKTAFGITNL